MFVCEDCINKFEPVAALATFYKTCEICGERRTCLDLAPNVKRIDSILELIIEHKDGKFINWSMRDPNDPTRKFGEDDTALIEQAISKFPEKEGGLLPDPYGDGVGWVCKECKKRVDPCPHLKDCLSQDDNGLTFNCEDLIDMDLCRLEKKKEILVEEPKIPSDEFFDDAKRHEMELMGGAPEHLMDRAVPSIQKMMTEIDDPEEESE